MYVDTDNIQMTKNKTIWWKNEQSFILQVMYKNLKQSFVLPIMKHNEVIMIKTVQFATNRLEELNRELRNKPSKMRELPLGQRWYRIRENMVWKQVTIYLEKCNM